MLYPFSLDRVETGRAIGHDLYRHGRHSIDDWPAQIREGYVEARARRLTRRLPDRYTRKWLQLRLNAYQRGRVVNADVTPDFLRAIDVAVCPITRERLSHGALADTDWSVDRLNNDGAYAVNNLAVMSTRANRAKGALAFAEVHARSQCGNTTDGLAPIEWLRLASMMLGPCFATHAADAPAIPLAAPIPLRSVRPAVQQIQHVLTLGARAQAGKNRLLKHLKAVSSAPLAQMRLRMLCEAMHMGLKGLEHAHDVWLVPGVMQAFMAWREALDLREFAAAGEIARGLAGARTVPRERLSTWHMGRLQ